MSGFAHGFYDDTNGKASRLLYCPIPNKSSDFIEDDVPLEKPSRKVMYFSIILLLLCLGVVVLLAKYLSKDVDALVRGLRAPKSLAGIIIA